MRLRQDPALAEPEIKNTTEFLGKTACGIESLAGVASMVRSERQVSAATRSSPRIRNEGSRALEIVHNGNLRTGPMALALAKARGELRRVVLGTDGPAGSGVQPLGILRTVTMLASLGDVRPR